MVAGGVGLARRVAVVLTAAFSCLCCAGLVFGFAGLYDKLVSHGVFLPTAGDPAGLGFRESPQEALRLQLKKELKKYKDTGR